jgi:phosphatidylserine decarboxylase
VVEWQYHRYGKKIAAAGNPAEIGATRLLFLLCLLFERERAHWIASICDAELPRRLRAPLLWVIAQLFNADLTEIKESSLESFPTIGDFFSRELRPGARQIDTAPGAVVSPADARVLALGSVTDPNSRVAQVEVKGTTFSLSGLLGTDPMIDLPAGKCLQYVAFHLGPGDYHRFHAPAEFRILSGKRFSGEGLPVSPLVTGRTNDVFSVNERVVLSGDWSGGRMHFVAVGAAHVRGIFLEVNDHLARELAPSDGLYYLDGRVTCTELSPAAPRVQVPPGSMMGGFRLGSAVVCVFEAPKDSRWRVAPGDRVRVGQQLFSEA